MDFENAVDTLIDVYKDTSYNKSIYSLYYILTSFGKANWDISDQELDKIVRTAINRINSGSYEP
jgi:hypothetical protein